MQKKLISKFRQIWITELVKWFLRLSLTATPAVGYDTTMDGKSRSNNKRMSLKIIFDNEKWCG